MMDDVFRRMRDSARQKEYNALNPQTPASGGINLGTGAGGAAAGGIAAKSKGQKPLDSVNLLRVGRALFKG
tara:strand:+ start:4225 stop:4437 length:213 start_codon:yes stop_codon:yes gene_type:complete